MLVSKEKMALDIDSFHNQVVFKEKKNLWQQPIQNKWMAKKVQH